MSKKSMNTKDETSAVRAWFSFAVSVALTACSGGNNSSPAPKSLGMTPVFNSVSTTQGGQSVIALDPVNQAIWVPSYTLDANGNLQYRLIGTAALVAGGTPAAPKSVSLSGCDTPIGIAFVATTGNATVGSMLVECGNSATDALVVVSIDAASLAVTPISTPGLSWGGDFGGIIYDPNGQAFIAASSTVGLIQVPTDGPPAFNANSATTLPYSTTSLAMDFVMQQVFITNLNYPYSILIDASTINPPPTPGLNIISQAQNPVNPSSGYSVNVNGATFDSATGLLTVSQASQGDFWATDTAYIFNDPASGNEPSETVSGFLDYLGGHGYGSSNLAGGLVALNTATHQTLIADIWGPNLFLMQQPLPSAAPILVLNNNGQPSPSGTPSPILPDGNSIYAVAQTELPAVNIAGVATQLNAVGDPNGVVIDSANNIAFVLADTDNYNAHSWTQNTGLSLYLVALDLSAPVQNACTGLCPTSWNPRTAEVNIP